LRRAGYSGEEVGVYIMVGLPGQRVGEVEESIAFVKETGAKPVLVEYSPVPHTPLFEKAKKMSQFDLENEPLFHNNSILPCQWDGFTMADYKRIKEKLGRVKR
jgi:dTDP-4-amino-4,6-dideoxygalactose transaminase